MSKLTMLYIHGDSADFEKVEPTLKNYYRLIGCDYIDIVSIYFNGKAYDVICDDEALLKEPPYSFAVISKEGHPMIAGNVLICTSEDGEEKPLSPADVINLLPALCWTVQNDKVVATIIAD